MIDEEIVLDPTEEPTDDQIEKSVDDSDDGHQAPFVTSVKDEHEDALAFDHSTASPSVLGEENPFGGDATDSESPDIDKALSDVGLSNDDGGIKPLGE